MKEIKENVRKLGINIVSLVFVEFGRTESYDKQFEDILFF